MPSKKNNRFDKFSYDELYALVRFFALLPTFHRMQEKSPIVGNKHLVEILKKLSMEIRMAHSVSLLTPVFRRADCGIVAFGKANSIVRSKREAKKLAEKSVRAHFKKTYGWRG